VVQTFTANALHRQLDELIELSQHDPVTTNDCHLAIALADDITRPLRTMLEALAKSDNPAARAAGKECLVLHELATRAMDAAEVRLE
jgi:hypothetical protein